MSFKLSLFTSKLCPTTAPHQHASLLLRSSPLLKSTAYRTLTAPRNAPTLSTITHRSFSSTLTSRMSFSNADTGNKPADPYKARNMDEPQLKEKIEDLVSFIEACKFGMMTTRIASTGLLVSRCMALAGKVSPTHRNPLPSTILPPAQRIQTNTLRHNRKAAGLPFFSTPIPNPAKPTTSNPTPKSTSPSSTPPANGPLSPAKQTLSPTAK